MNGKNAALLVLGVGAAALLLPGLASATIEGNVVSQAKVVAFAEAIAYAEGFWDRNRKVLIGNRAARDNNPGDLEATGDAGQDGPYAKYSTAQVGWQALYNKVQFDLSGQSGIYSPSMTISDFAWTYTATAQDAWSESVANWLSVTRDTVIADWLNS